LQSISSRFVVLKISLAAMPLGFGAPARVGTIATRGRAAGREPCGARRRDKFGLAGPIARRDDELAALPPSLAFRRSVAPSDVEFIVEDGGGAGVRLRKAAK
jgi:hypothetical protein